MLLVCWSLFCARPRTMPCSSSPSWVHPAWFSGARHVAPPSPVQNKQLPPTVLFTGHFAYVGVFLWNESLDVKSLVEVKGPVILIGSVKFPSGGGARTPPRQGPPRARPLPHPCQLRVLSKAALCPPVRCSWRLSVGLRCFSVITSQGGHRAVG